MKKNNILEKIKTFANLLDNEKYDEIYEKFGKVPYFLFADFKHKKQDINKLVEKQDYVTLYKKYGEYELFTRKIFRNHIKKLIKEGKYLDILSVYGENEYQKNHYKMKKLDIMSETGKKSKANSYIIKEIVLSGASNLLASTIALGIFYNGGFTLLRNYSYYEALKNNRELLQEYNYKINNYASYINSLNIEDDLQIVMKVMDDMWNEMAGYKTPKSDYDGLFRLALLNENSVGVCRHIADDMANRLNTINPKYNAKTLTVTFNNDAYKIENFADIERRDLTDHTENTSEEIKDENENNFDFTKYTGNHLVCSFNPIGKNYTIIIDPTNPSIGVLLNGKIYMFQTKNHDGLSFKPLGELIITIETNITMLKYDFINSFFIPDTDKYLEELNNNWGLEAQNKALEEIRKNITTSFKAK